MAEANLTFYLLLLAALAIGWGLGWIAGKSRKRAKRSVNDIYHDYFVGLNYLLRDEPDEAIDTFIRALAINGDTIETHLALGTLLRRRGKVDKAIKVHQALLARAGLASDFADSVRLELSNDYIAAGLLDRAERLLKELLADGSPAKPEALLQLTTIYQIEKEWLKAIDTVSALLMTADFKKDKSIRSIAAHFCCELADQSLSSGQHHEARDSIKRAFQFDRSSARATLQLAKIELLTNNTSRAIKELERICHQHPEFISEVIDLMAQCYEQLDSASDLRKFEQFMLKTLEVSPRAGVLLKLVELVRKRDGNAAAGELLSGKLRQNPSLKGAAALLSAQAVDVEGSLQSNLEFVSDTIDKLLQSKPGFKCDQCGFESRAHYWQCPSCRKWDSVKPVLGVEGE